MFDGLSKKIIELLKNSRNSFKSTVLKDNGETVTVNTGFEIVNALKIGRVFDKCTVVKDGNTYYALGIAFTPTKTLNNNRLRLRKTRPVKLKQVKKQNVPLTPFVSFFIGLNYVFFRYYFNLKAVEYPTETLPSLDDWYESPRIIVTKSDNSKKPTLTANFCFNLYLFQTPATEAEALEISSYITFNNGSTLIRSNPLPGLTVFTEDEDLGEEGTIVQWFNPVGFEEPYSWHDFLVYKTEVLPVGTTTTNLIATTKIEPIQADFIFERHDLPIFGYTSSQDPANIIATPTYLKKAFNWDYFIPHSWYLYKLLNKEYNYFQKLPFFGVGTNTFTITYSAVEGEPYININSVNNSSFTGDPRLIGLGRDWTALIDNIQLLEEEEITGQLAWVYDDTFEAITTFTATNTIQENEDIIVDPPNLSGYRLYRAALETETTFECDFNPYIKINQTKFFNTLAKPKDIQETSNFSRHYEAENYRNQDELTYVNTYGLGTSNEIVFGNYTPFSQLKGDLTGVSGGVKRLHDDFQISSNFQVVDKYEIPFTVEGVALIEKKNVTRIRSTNIDFQNITYVGTGLVFSTSSIGNPQRIITHLLAPGGDTELAGLTETTYGFSMVDAWFVDDAVLTNPNAFHYFSSVDSDDFSAEFFKVHKKNTGFVIYTKYIHSGLKSVERTKNYDQTYSFLYVGVLGYTFQQNLDLTAVDGGNILTLTVPIYSNKLIAAPSAFLGTGTIESLEVLSEEESYSTELYLNNTKLKTDNSFLILADHLAFGLNSENYPENLTSFSFSTENSFEQPPKFIINIEDLLPNIYFEKNYTKNKTKIDDASGPVSASIGSLTPIGQTYNSAAVAASTNTIGNTVQPDPPDFGNPTSNLSNPDPTIVYDPDNIYQTRYESVITTQGYLKIPIENQDSLSLLYSCDLVLTPELEFSEVEGQEHILLRIKYTVSVSNLQFVTQTCGLNDQTKPIIFTRNALVYLFYKNANQRPLINSTIEDALVPDINNIGQFIPKTQVHCFTKTGTTKQRSIRYVEIFDLESDEFRFRESISHHIFKNYTGTTEGSSNFVMGYKYTKPT